MLLVGNEIVFTMISKEFLSEAISDTSFSIYNILKSCLISQNILLKNTLSELDLHAKLKTINILINDIKYNSIILKQCLSDVHDIILIIYNELHLINIELKKHEDKYFKNWRYPNIQNNIINIKNYNNILTMRLDILFKVLSISNNIKINKEHID